MTKDKIDRCKECGANLALVGMRHRCVAPIAFIAKASNTAPPISIAESHRRMRERDRGVVHLPPHPKEKQSFAKPKKGKSDASRSNKVRGKTNTC